MKHTDVLLKIQDEELDPDNRKEKQQRLNQLTTKLKLVHELSQNAGWKLFQQELKDEERKVLTLLERSNDSTNLAKLTGTLLAIKGFLDWPEYVAREVEEQANDLKED